MANINGLLSKFLNGGVGTNLASGMAGGLASSMIVTKSDRKIGKNVLQLGGVAAIGVLAYSAYQRFKNKRDAVDHTVSNEKQGGKTPEILKYLPAENDMNATDELGLTFIRAMIAASRVDGLLDAQESQSIYQQIQSLELDEEQQQLMVDEMSHPVDMDIIVKAATSQEIAIEIYMVSLLAIEDQSAAEKAYLSMLAEKMKLPMELVNAIEEEVNQQRALN